ncbi:DNA internalization-related competence protein ComEC/Rec2 [Allochromatium vinosum]|uniref:DNA internalization-related competence protein ComEC/Rec2 n=1 Tax=Allochromatium vinosum (strain ATCC 17899 / DSM 180 / NBRC 103801 / NCIMB 10441 / D) TaxID=572477 RepID=D3RQI9_ALLVD|nr:DNA internalization-related competence protein ComEC/Rec2 [Allochromatium vinosum]ADC61794.1 DNA internalization-related competence protein ComEC/Rec2 [Allochromatium vinosum DSM 180]
MRFDVGLGFVLGVIGLYRLSALPPWWAVVLGLSASAVLAWVWPRTRWMLFLCLGFGWAWFHACQLLCAPFPEGLARAPLVVEGRVTSIPGVEAHRTRFLLDVERTWDARGAELDVSGRVRISCYRDCPTLSAGERWRIDVRLKPRHGSLNPGGFDYERWLFEQGLVATGYPRGRDAFARLDTGPGGYWLTRLRQRLAEHLARMLDGSPQLGLIQALTLGERSALERETWETFSRTGTSHLVAISGLHVGLVAGGVFWLARRLWARSTRLTLLLAAPRAAAVFSLLAGFGYAALAGFAISTQRALIMLAVVLGALFWQRTLRPYQALRLALVGVLVWDPGAVLSYGFWLSFGAVAFLLLHLGQRLPGRDLWTRWGRAQWAVGLGLLPLLFLFFGQASLIAPLVNLVAVPLFSAPILPLVLIASLLSLVPVTGFAVPLRLVADGLGWCLNGLDWLAAQPWSAVHLPAQPLWAWGSALLGAVLLLAPRGLPGRWLGWILMLPLVAARPATPGWGEVWFSLLDVGQGQAAVVETLDGILVYDAGPAYPGGFDTGAMMVAPFLRSRGIERIDRLVVSHADRDHAGGAAGLLALVPADDILTGEPARLKLAGAQPCLAGETWVWSGVAFRLLHPKPAELAAGLKGNEASCVLEIRTADQAILLTGDVGARTEERLAEHLGADWRVTVLIAGHHGSATSTSARLLDAARPEWVLFSSGYANQFGFPARAVRERLAARGIPTLNTALDGAIRFRLGPNGWIEAPQGWRTHAGRLWTHRPARPP